MSRCRGATRHYNISKYQLDCCAYEREESKINNLLLASKAPRVTSNNNGCGSSSSNRYGGEGQVRIPEVDIQLGRLGSGGKQGQWNLGGGGAASRGEFDMKYGPSTFRQGPFCAVLRFGG